MSKTKTATRPATTSLARMRGLLASLHETIGHRLLEGSHDRWDDGLDSIAQSMWIESSRKGVSVHLCPDRYCDCHVTLSLSKPPELPLDDE